MSENPKKCAFPSCTCTTDECSDYCSQVCADTKNILGQCQCEHPGCQMEASPERPGSVVV